jgi:hypothetical protein
MVSSTFALKSFLERREIHRHLAVCLSAYDEGDEEPTDSVALELQGDRHLRAGIRVRLHRDVDNGPDGPVDPTDTPLTRRVEAHEFRGVGSVGETDASRRMTVVTDLWSAGAVDVTADDSLLPFRETTWVSHIGEHFLN